MPKRLEEDRFPVFVISNDDSRWERTARELASSDLQVVRVPGVVPEIARKDPRVSGLAKVFCTDKILAVALAHINTASLFLETSDAPLCLIFEDDVRISPRAEVSYASIRGCVLDALLSNEDGKEWDIIRLHSAAGGAPFNSKSPSVEFCTPPLRSHPLTVSLAAYLLSRAGALKLTRHKVVYHLDVLVNSAGFNTFCGPQLFETFDLQGGPRIKGQDWAYYANNEVLRLGAFRVRVGAFCVTCFAVFVVVLLMGRCPITFQQGRWWCQALQQLGLAYLATCLSFFSLLYCGFFYRCAREVSSFFIVYAVIVILFCLLSRSSSQTLAKNLVLFGAYVMLSYHMFHEALKFDGSWPVDSLATASFCPRIASETTTAASHSHDCRTDSKKAQSRYH